MRILLSFYYAYWEGQGRARWGICGRILALFVLTSLTGNAINPGCRCIRFRNTFGKEWGTFSSPDYPSSYPLGIPCLLYSFQAPKDFIVQLQLEHIHLPSYPNGCHTRGDYLKIFLHLEEEGVNEETEWNSLLCGQRSNETYFSASRHLIIQFHSSTGSSASSPEVSPLQIGSNSDSAQNLGFHGSFRFLNSSQYESNGRLVAGTKCDYRFESTNYSSPNGKFFSPLYPSTYPHNAMCAYLFRARPHERVKVVFESVALEPGLYTCLNKTDIIRVVDGSTSRAPVIALICNSIKDYEIVSSGQDLLVEFIGNSGTPGEGFRAKFHFIKVIYDNPYDPSRFNLQQYFPKLDIHKAIGEDGQPQASTLVPQCDSVIRSDNGPNGSISSPNYPNAYPPKSHCRFDFIGHGRQRVQLSFVDFDLYHSRDGIYMGNTRGNLSKDTQALESEKMCAYSDSVSAFVYINGKRTKVLEHCGTNPPPDFMSSDHRMTLEFSAKASTTTPSLRGFYAQYSFVEDFGMSNTRGGVQLLDYPCAFVFNISVSLNGTITSPNYPGLYPRETECHYFFHGDDRNHVNLFFQHFDLPGTNPCTSERDDYIEYSNYMPTDGRFLRKCGSNSGGFWLSSAGVDKGRFFRVTFRSNDGWGDGTGFRANFTFTHKINQIPIVNVNSASSTRARPLPPGSQSIQTLLFFWGTKLTSFTLPFFSGQLSFLHFTR